MDRTRRWTTGILRELIWRSPMGFHSESFRFEGGGRTRCIGLKRTGKSCRLRWVNYLHPGLKRGKMTPHEERLVLELHSKWGNRWSRIAQRLPGRTDNEIKNYWRTHMRKTAQEKKKAAAVSHSSSSSSSLSSSSSTAHSPNTEPCPTTDSIGRSFYDTGGNKDLIEAENTANVEVQKSPQDYSMDEIWKDIELSEENSNFTCQAMNSPVWCFGPTDDSLWSVDGHFHSHPYYNHMIG